MALSIIFDPRLTNDLIEIGERWRRGIRLRGLGQGSFIIRAGTVAFDDAITFDDAMAIQTRGGNDSPLLDRIGKDFDPRFFR